MKAITKLLKSPLKDDILKARTEKAIKARNNIACASNQEQCHPKSEWYRSGEDPATWISASSMSDASLHRLACTIFQEGLKKIDNEIKQIYDAHTIEFIGKILRLGYRTNRALGHLVGKDIQHICPSLFDQLLTDCNNNNFCVEQVTNLLIKEWDHRRKQKTGLRILEQVDNGAKVFSPSFLENVEYVLDDLRSALYSIRPRQGTIFDSIYRQSDNYKTLKDKRVCLMGCGLTGIFEQLYRVTKGYSHPMCRACLYSPKSRTFWYALKPLHLSDANNSDENSAANISHSFDNIWIQWNPSKFAESLGTYSENAITVFRTGDLTAESASGAHFHPHVGDSGSICLGNAGSMFRLSEQAFSVSASIDIVIGVLSEYVYGDAFSKLERFTMDQAEWDALHRHEDNEDCRFCENCGDEVDVDDDIWCNESGCYFHQDCAVFSEYEQCYISEASSIWSDFIDSYIGDTVAVCLAPESEVGDYIPYDHEETYFLWLPESLDARRNVSSSSRETLWGTRLLRQHLLRDSSGYTSDVVNTIAFIHETDIQPYHGGDDPENSMFVPLSESVYSQIIPDFTTSCGVCLGLYLSKLWGRRDDCIEILQVNDKIEEKVDTHYILKTHLNTPKVHEIITELGWADNIVGTPITNSNETKENEDTQ